MDEHVKLAIWLMPRRFRFRTLDGLRGLALEEGRYFQALLRTYETDERRWIRQLGRKNYNYAWDEAYQRKMNETLL